MRTVHRDIPATMQHVCCTSAQLHLIGHRIHPPCGPYRWKLQSPGTPTLLLIYCPWCGCELNEWAEFQLAKLPPRLRLVEEVQP